MHNIGKNTQSKKSSSSERSLQDIFNILHQKMISNILNSPTYESTMIDQFSSSSSSQRLATTNVINDPVIEAILKLLKFQDDKPLLPVTSLNNLVTNPSLDLSTQSTHVPAKTIDNLSTKPANNNNSTKSYPCEICGRVFQRLQHKNRHVISVHTTLRPYKCSYCPKDFKRTEHLKAHYNNHHPNLPIIVPNGNNRRGRPKNAVGDGKNSTGKNCVQWANSSCPKTMISGKSSSLPTQQDLRSLHDLSNKSVTDIISNVAIKFKQDSDGSSKDSESHTNISKSSLTDKNNLNDLFKPLVGVSGSTTEKEDNSVVGLTDVEKILEYMNANE